MVIMTVREVILLEAMSLTNIKGRYAHVGHSSGIYSRLMRDFTIKKTTANLVGFLEMGLLFMVENSDFPGSIPLIR